jgi:hypothetical protein
VYSLLTRARHFGTELAIGRIDFPMIFKSSRWRIMLALHDKPWSSAGHYVCKIVTMLVVMVAFACGLGFQAAKAQVRIGIGAAGIGGVLLNDALRNPQYQRDVYPDADSTKKSAKTKNRNHANDERKTAKHSRPADTSSAEKPPITDAPTKSPPTEPPRPVSTSTTADKFGD